MNLKNKNWICYLLIIGLFIWLLSNCKKDDNSPSNITTSNNTIRDTDGNVYHFITIGTQIWMVENLKTTKYNDGTIIPNITDINVWGILTTPGVCTYNNTSNSDTINTYGHLYNWYAVNTNKLAPKGWHIPSDSEWTILTSNFGGDSIAGGILKEQGTTHWSTPNTGGNNKSGLKALPGGYRYIDGSSYYMSHEGNWWSSNMYDTTYAWGRIVHYNDSIVERDYYSKNLGFSVRCLKNNSSQSKK